MQFFSFRLHLTLLLCLFQDLCFYHHRCSRYFKHLAANLHLINFDLHYWTYFLCPSRNIIYKYYNYQLICRCIKLLTYVIGCSVCQAYINRLVYIDLHLLIMKILGSYLLSSLLIISTNFNYSIVNHSVNKMVQFYSSLAVHLFISYAVHFTRL